MLYSLPLLPKMILLKNKNKRIYNEYEGGSSFKRETQFPCCYDLGYEGGSRLIMYMHT
jgi:hypothetical protein